MKKLLLLVVFLLACQPVTWPGVDKPELWLDREGVPQVMETAPVLICTNVPEHVQAGIDVWTKWLGYRLMKIVDDCSDASVGIVYDNLTVSFYNGLTYPGRDKKLVILYTLNGGTLLHELGHVLGLDHDPDNPKSIMYPTSQRYNPGLEPQDKRVLNGWYKKRLRN